MRNASVVAVLVLAGCGNGGAADQSMVADSALRDPADAVRALDEGAPDLAIAFDAAAPDQAAATDSAALDLVAAPDAAPPDSAVAPDAGALDSAATPDGPVADGAVAVAPDSASAGDAAARDSALPRDSATPPDLVMVCDPAAPPSCDGMDVKTCAPDGSGYVVGQCLGGAFCVNGYCGCVPGVTACQGASVQKCGQDGQFHALFDCPHGTLCVGGRCDDVRCPLELNTLNGVGLAGGWPRYRHDNRNSGFTNSVVADSPKPVWKVFVGGTNYDQQKGLASAPVVNDSGRVFIGAGELDGKNGQLYAFDSMGKPVYAFAANRVDGLSTPAVLSDGTAYVASGDSTLWAIKPDGTALWSYKTGNSADGDPIVAKDGTLVYPSDDGSLYALDPKGNLVWKSDPVAGPGHDDAGLAEACDGRIVAGGTNGWYSLDPKTGKTLWKVTATGIYQANNASPVLSADGIMYGLDGGGTGWAIDPMGKVIWSRKVGPAGASPPLHLGTSLYVVLNDGALHALDASTGQEQWSRPVGYALTRDVGQIAGPVADGNLRIYVNSTDGNLYCFERDGTSRFKIAVSGVAAAQIFAGGMAIGSDGTVFVSGNDGTLYVLR